MSSKKKSVSLSEKISNLITATPTVFGSDNESEETKAKLVDCDDEFDNDENDDFESQFKSSNIRKRNVNLLEEIDKRYLGKKVSRKEIFNHSSDDNDSSQDNYTEESSEENEQNEADENSDNVSLNNSEEDSNEDENQNCINGNENSEHSENEDSSDNENENSSNEDFSKDDEEESDLDNDFSDIDTFNPLRRDRSSDKDITTVTRTNVRAEIEKGNCTREQLRLWENFLEMRIKLQKCIIASNKLPQYDVYKNYECNSEFKKGCNDAKFKLSSLLNNLLNLQSNLLNNYSETRNILIKNNKRKINNESSINDEENGDDEEIPSDTEDENDNENVNMEVSASEESENEDKEGPPKKIFKLSKFESIISKNHNLYKEYRNSVIQKWNDKTRIASGVISKGVNQPAVKQIEFAMANKEKLLKKTQLRRSEYNILGKSESSIQDNDGRRTQEYDTEIYDDDDFYHQLLRELIEYKSANVTDPIQLSKQWIQLQNMRSKMKRKIDTRATKGRRIRYNVHQKLINFMAPITVNDSWTDHAKDELYSSLFGKIKAVTQETNPT